MCPQKKQIPNKSNQIWARANQIQIKYGPETNQIKSNGGSGKKKKRQIKSNSGPDKSNETKYEHRQIKSNRGRPFGCSPNPPSIAHTRCVKGPSICANHTATAVKSAITISLQVATGCTGVMSVCANQSSLSRHNLGGCVGVIANKGGISNSRYTWFERTSPR